MKKIIYLAISFGIFIAAVSVPAVAEAQTIKSVIKTISTADTVTFTNVPSKVKSFQYTYTESSGTTAGKVYIEGAIDVNGGWKLLDSITLADNTNKQVLYYIPTATSYLTYRFRNTNTSSATGAVRAYYLRRTDE